MLGLNKILLIVGIYGATFKGTDRLYFVRLKFDRHSFVEVQSFQIIPSDQQAVYKETENRRKENENSNSLTMLFESHQW